MKKNLILVLVFLLLISTLSACKSEPNLEPEPEDLNIITYNIKRRDFQFEWSFRQELMSAYVDKYEPDIMGLQEVSMSQHEWIKYLPSAFGKKYTYVGEARTDIATEGIVACLIFYNKDKFNLLESGTFWLNESGEKGAKGWDAQVPHICTYALLKTKKSQKKILVLNTHLDAESQEARIKGFDLIMDKATEISNFEYPVFIMGDFNTYGKEDNDEYMHFLSYEDIVDTKDIAVKSQGYETYTCINSEMNYPTDFILMSKNDDVHVNEYNITDDYNVHKYTSGVLMSDHYGVRINITIN